MQIMWILRNCKAVNYMVDACFYGIHSVIYTILISGIRTKKYGATADFPKMPDGHYDQNMFICQIYILVRSVFLLLIHGTFSIINFVRM